MTRLIGLTGHARSGKDTAALALVAEGFVRRAFARPVYEGVRRLNPIVFQGGGETLRVADIVDAHGWDKAKTLWPEVRQLLQRYGTEAGRDIHGERCWIDLCLADLRDHNVVVTDLRFPNEAGAIRDAGGAVIEITRPGVGPVNGHASDAGLPLEMIDCTIRNSGTIDELHRRVVEAAGVLQPRPLATCVVAAHATADFGEEE